MAEFIEVMRQQQRMCKSMASCQMCRIHNANPIMKCEEFMTDYPEKAQAIIMGWASDNPEKTNKKVLVETIEEKFGSEIAEMVSQKISMSISVCTFLDCLKGCKEDDPCGYCKYENFWHKAYTGPVEG